jgi:predicted PurR-regulated permease PerM
MKSPDSAKIRLLEDRTFQLLVIATSLAFAWIVWQYAGAVLWATVIAIVFAPLQRRIVSLVRQRRTLAALTTETIVLVMVILPIALIAVALLQEAASVYARVQSGELHLGLDIRRLSSNLPAWVVHLLDRLGLTDLGAVQERLSNSLTRIAQFIAAQVLNFGQNAAGFIVSLFVMLYLLFFLLRDGDALVRRIKIAVPLRAGLRQELSSRFAIVIRATVKGNLVVAVAQGALGGLIFWLLGIHAPVLWGALMALLSLLPAVGAALVWLPVAIYLAVTGSTWQGVVLAAYGVLVISTVDNILRPILVGKDTKMPDYVVLIATLGGIAIFGANGLVIGPVIAAMFITVWDIFASWRKRSAIEQPGPDTSSHA